MHVHLVLLRTFIHHVDQHPVVRRHIRLGNVDRHDDLTRPGDAGNLHRPLKDDIRPLGKGRQDGEDTPHHKPNMHFVDDLIQQQELQSDKRRVRPYTRCCNSSGWQSPVYVKPNGL